MALALHGTQHLGAGVWQRDTLALGRRVCLFDAVTVGGHFMEQAVAVPSKWDEEKKNYERSYKSMWEEIYRLRDARDRAWHPSDAAKDLLLALQFDLGNGLRLSGRSFTAYLTLAAKLGMNELIRSSPADAKAP